MGDQDALQEPQSPTVPLMLIACEGSFTKSKEDYLCGHGCSAPTPRSKQKTKTGRIRLSPTGLLVRSPVQAHDWRFPWRGQRSVHIML